VDASVRMEGHRWLSSRTLPPPAAAERLRLKGRKGMVREIVRRRAYRPGWLAAGGACERAWAPQRSTASHIVQAGGQRPISVQRHERTPRIGGSRYWEISRAPLLVFVFAHCCAVLLRTRPVFVGNMTKTPSTLFLSSVIGRHDSRCYRR
jgi:hypothetical protein